MCNELLEKRSTSTRLSFDASLQSGLVWKLRVDAKVDVVDVELSFSYFRDVQCVVVGSSAASMLRPFVPGDVQLTLNIWIYSSVSKYQRPLFRKFLSEEKKENCFYRNRLAH